MHRVMSGPPGEEQPTGDPEIVVSTGIISTERPPITGQLPVPSELAPGISNPRLLFIRYRLDARDLQHGLLVMTDLVTGATARGRLVDDPSLPPEQSAFVDLATGRRYHTAEDDDGATWCYDSETGEQLHDGDVVAG